MLLFLLESQILDNSMKVSVRKTCLSFLKVQIRIGSGSDSPLVKRITQISKITKQCQFLQAVFRAELEIYSHSMRLEWHMAHNITRWIHNHSHTDMVHMNQGRFNQTILNSINKDLSLYPQDKPTSWKITQLILTL